jgi:hypothetical protein
MHYIIINNEAVFVKITSTFKQHNIFGEVVPMCECESLAGKFYEVEASEVYEMSSTEDIINSLEEELK